MPKIEEALNSEKNKGQSLVSELKGLEKDSREAQINLNKFEAKNPKPQKTNTAKFTKWEKQDLQLREKLSKSSDTFSKKKNEVCESILTTQALMMLKEQHGKDAEITQEELDKELDAAKRDNGFLHAVMDNLVSSGDRQYLELAFAYPEKLHNLVKQGNEKLPWLTEWHAISDRKMLFGKEPPTNKAVNEYSAEREAIDSFALLSVAYSHKADIESGTYTIKDLFSLEPEHLQERQTAYDNAWNAIQKKNNNWIAEISFEGGRAASILCEKAAKNLRPSMSPNEILNQPEILMIAKLQHTIHDDWQEWMGHCPAVMLQYLNQKYKANLPSETPPIDDPKYSEKSREIAKTANKYIQKNYPMPVFATELIIDIRKIKSETANIMFAKEFKPANINLSRNCADVISSVEDLFELNDRLAAHGDIIHMAKDFDHLEPKQIHEKALSFGFTDDKIPEIFNKLDIKSKQEIFDELNNESKQEIFDKLDNKSKKAINNDDQIKDIEAQLKREQNPDTQTSLETQKNARISELIRPYAEKKFLTDRVPPTTEDAMAGKETFTSMQANQILSFLANDQTGELGRNLLDDILSGEFSKQNGGHNLITEIDLNFKAFTTPLSDEQFLQKYTPDKMKKDIWEDKLACSVLKFNALATMFSADITDKEKAKGLMLYCSNDVSKSQYNPASDPDPNNDLLKNYHMFKDLRPNPGDPKQFIICGDGSQPVITADEMAGFDHKKTQAAYDDLIGNFQKDVSHEDNEKVRDLRQAELDLLNTPDKEFARAMFRNHHLRKIVAMNGDIINIQEPAEYMIHELGKDTFNKTVDMRIQANKEILRAIETEKLLAKSSTERQTEKYKKDEARHLKALWEEHKKTTSAYDALIKIDTDQFITCTGKDDTELNRMGHSSCKMELRKNGKQKPVLMQTDITDMRDDNRGPRVSIGWIRGEQKAIENGWGLGELSLLGMIGQLEEASKGALPVTLKNNANTFRQQKEFHEAVLKLKEEVWFKPVQTGREKKEVADKITDFINKQMKQMKENPLTQELFKDVPLKKIQKTLSAVKRLLDGQKLEVDNNNSVKYYINNAFNSTSTPLPFLNALTNVPKSDISKALTFIYKNKGISELEKYAEVLAEAQAEVMNNLTESVERISQDYLEHPDKVDEKYNEHISCSTLRKQLAWNSLKNTNMMERALAYREIANKLGGLNVLTNAEKEKLQTKLETTFYSHIGDRTYKHTTKTEFTKALTDGGLDPSVLKQEMTNQSRLIEKCNSNLKGIASTAEKKYEALQKTLATPEDLSERSGEFVRMYNAVKKFSQLTDKNTPAEIVKAISEMSISADEYIKKNEKLNFNSDSVKIAKEIQDIVQTTKNKDNGIDMSKLYIDKNKSLLDSLTQSQKAADAITDPQNEIIIPNQNQNQNEIIIPNQNQNNVPRKKGKGHGMGGPGS